MSPITQLFYPEGHRVRKHKVTQSHKFHFVPVAPLALLLLPGRLWHSNKFLASVHVPDLYTGKVTLPAITNMGWALLFPPAWQSLCESLSLKSTHASAMCVSKMTRRDVCLSDAYVCERRRLRSVGPD